jgi:hypothetical protein
MNGAFRRFLSAVGAATIVSSSTSALAQAPAAPAAAPPAVGGCVKDVECKGDRICVEGRCVAPAPAAPPTLTPVPAPAPVVVPAPAGAVVVAPPPPVAAPPPVAPPPPSLPPPPPPPVVEVVPPRPASPPTTIIVYAPPPPDVVTPTGPSFGLRFGVGFPAGNVSSGVAASAIVGYLFPVTLDLGYRLSPHWYIGGYLSVAYGTPADSTCGSMGTGLASCYETDIRVGADVQYHFFPSAKLQPWVGVGAGWEVLNEISTDDMGDDTSDSKNGIEFFHLDLGVDYRVGARDKLGVYFLSTVSDLEDSSVHAWFMLGGRWRHDLDTLQR